MTAFPLGVMSESIENDTEILQQSQCTGWGECIEKTYRPGRAVHFLSNTQLEN